MIRKWVRIINVFVFQRDSIIRIKVLKFLNGLIIRMVSNNVRPIPVAKSVQKG